MERRIGSGAAKQFTGRFGDTVKVESLPDFELEELFNVNYQKTSLPFNYFRFFATDRMKQMRFDKMAAVSTYISVYCSTCTWVTIDYRHGSSNPRLEYII